MAQFKAAFFEKIPKDFRGIRELMSENIKINHLEVLQCDIDHVKISVQDFSLRAIFFTDIIIIRGTSCKMISGQVRSRDNLEISFNNNYVTLHQNTKLKLLQKNDPLTTVFEEGSQFAIGKKSFFFIEYLEIPNAQVNTKKFIGVPQNTKYIGIRLP